MTKPVNKITIIRDDGMMINGSKGHKVDLSDLPDYIHAVQWDGEKGHIEFKPDKNGVQPGNLPITAFDPFDHIGERWNQAEKKWNEDMQAAAAEADKRAAEEAENKKLTPVERKQKAQEKKNEQPEPSE